MGRVEALDLLLRHGASLDAKANYRAGHATDISTEGCVPVKGYDGSAYYSGPDGFGNIPSCIWVKNAATPMDMANKNKQKACTQVLFNEMLKKDLDRVGREQIEGSSDDSY